MTPANDLSRDLESPWSPSWHVHGGQELSDGDQMALKTMIDPRRKERRDG